MPPSALAVGLSPDNPAVGVEPRFDAAARDRLEFREGFIAVTPAKSSLRLHHRDLERGAVLDEVEHALLDELSRLGTTHPVVTEDVTLVNGPPLAFGEGPSVVDLARDGLRVLSDVLVG